MRQATMQRLIHVYIQEGGPDLPLYVSSLVEQERVLKAKVAEIQRRLKNEEDQHQRAKHQILHQLGDVRLECPHHETTYHGDPSGGNSSFTDCDLCGAEVRK